MSKSKVKNSHQSAVKNKQNLKNLNLGPWLIVLPVFLLLPVIYSTKAIDQVLVPRFLWLAVVLLIYYLIVFFKKNRSLIHFEYFTDYSFIFWLLFLIFSIISLVNAVNPIEGLFDILRIFLMFMLLFMLVNELNRKDMLKSVVFSVTITAVVYLVTGYIQYFRYAFGHDDLQALYKVIGIWMHKNFFSGMLFLMIPVLLYGFIEYPSFRNITGIILFADLNLIFILQTRSVWLSVILFVFIMGLLSIIYRKHLWLNLKDRKIINAFISFAIIVVLSIAVSWGITRISVSQEKDQHRAERHREVMKENSSRVKPIEERAASMFDVKEANTRHRIEMWKMSWRMIREHPLLGVGAGNWKIVVADYLPKDYNKKYFNNIRRPHNDLLWIFSEKGVFALLSYLAFFFTLLIYTIRVIRNATVFDEKLKVLIALSGIGGYFADSMLSFPHERIEHQTMLMLYSAIIISVYFKSFPVLSTENKILKYRKSIKWGIVILLMGCVYSGKKWYSDEINLNQAIKATISQNWDKCAEFSNKAIHSISQLDARNIPAAWYSGKAYLMLENNEKALEYLELAYQQNPNSILTLIDLGSVYGKLDRDDEAIALFKKALKIYPSYKDAYRNLGIAYYKKKDYDKSLEYFETLASLEYNPDVNNIIEMIKNLKQKK